ncbi:MAG: hypothetical protein V2B20_01915 [Pseudomonadota bacterium]
MFFERQWPGVADQHVGFRERYMRTIIVSSLILIIVAFFEVDSFSQESETDNQSLKLYSVDVPETSIWKNNSSSNQLLFGRTLSGPLSTATLTAKSYPAPSGVGNSILELLAQVNKSAKDEVEVSGRYQLINHSEKVAGRSDLDCVKYEKEWIDHGGEKTNWQELKMLAKGYICFHPESPYHLVEVNYSIRDHSASMDEKALNEGEYFINSLQFD